MAERRAPNRLGQDLPGIVDLIRELDGPHGSSVLWLRLREDELGCRLRAKRFRVGERVSDNLAKLGGGSLLAATVALVLGSQPSPLVIAMAAFTLLAFLIGTISSAAFEDRAAIWDHEGDKLAAAIVEVREHRRHG